MSNLVEVCSLESTLFPYSKYDEDSKKKEDDFIMVTWCREMKTSTQWIKLFEKSNLDREELLEIA